MSAIGERADVVAFDLGTNTFRWLALRSGTPVGRGREVVALGTALPATGAIGADEIAVAVDLLQRWRPGAGIVPPAVRVVAAGTHALRVASNGRDVAAQLGAALNDTVWIVDAETEAALTYGGAIAALGVERDPWAVLDIGGGSTEVAWGEGPELLGSLSVPVGVVTLRGPHDERLARAVERVERAVAATYSEVYNDTLAVRLRGLNPRQLASNCGTSSALALAYLGRHDYDRAALHGCTPTAAWLDQLLSERVDWVAADWAGVPGVGTARQHLIGPGIGILRAVLAAARQMRWTNSEAGLLEGLAHNPDAVAKE